MWFITAFTSARHLSLSWARSMQSTSPNPTSWRSILLLSSLQCHGLTSGFFSLCFHTETLYTLPFPHTWYMPRPSHSSQFEHLNNIPSAVQILKGKKFTEHKMCGLIFSTPSFSEIFLILRWIQQAINSCRSSCKLPVILVWF